MYPESKQYQIYVTHLHQLFITAKVCHQHILSISDPSQRDAQTPVGNFVSVGWQRLMHHGPQDLNQVEGRVHGPQEALLGFFSHIYEVGTHLSCHTNRETAGNVET